jgi:hypothetical protein
MSTKDLNAILRVYEDVFIKTEGWRELTDEELKTYHHKFYEITNSWDKYASKLGMTRIKKLKAAIKVARITRIRERIFEQCSELIEIKTEKFGTFTTARAPFLRWCLRYMDTSLLSGKVNPEWTPVAGTGWKMHMDDPFHTDWWMALTPQVDLKEAYNHDYDNSVGGNIAFAAHEMRSEIVTEYTKHQFVTLCRGDKRDYHRFYGRIEFPEPNEDVPPGSIAVVPHAGPEYQIAMETANKPNDSGDRGCIICNTGGKLAHLAVVGREMGATVLMVPDATTKYKWCGRLWIDLKEGTIEVAS